MTTETTHDCHTPVCTVTNRLQLGHKVCELLAFCKPDPDEEAFVNGHTMLSRGQADDASMNEEDFWYFWKFREQIPLAIANCHFFAFPMMTPNAYGEVECVYLYQSRWYHRRNRLARAYKKDTLLIRLSL